MKIGFVVNPFAGLGGSVALKGSDGEDIVQEALSRGAKPQAQNRAKTAMQAVFSESDAAGETMFYTASGDMGENVLQALSLPCKTLYKTADLSSAIDTKEVIRLFIKEKVDLIVFAGGDGTARDVLDVLSGEIPDHVPVIGIPAGVKIHSAVYASTPTHAGELIKLIISGRAMSLQEAQVMDLDEQAFRDGKVISQCYGYLTVPVDDTRMQLIKQGGLNHEDIIVQDIAAEVIENMEADVIYLMGSGSTTAEIMNQLNLPNTLLGVDVICNQELIASDVDEKSILKQIDKHPAKMVITIIGGQGHLFGRGNQQFSAQVIRHVGRENIIIIATDEKLLSLDHRPMIADTGDTELDKQLAGLYSVVTGYQQKTLYKLS